MSLEKQFLRWLRQRASAIQDDSIVRGIGDDGAIVQIANQQWAIVADAIGEGSHFQLTQDNLEWIGRKSVAVNLSDIAAMGARPAFATLTINASSSIDQSALQKIYVGAERISAEFGLQIIGGDTNVWSGPLTVSVTIFGQIVDQPWCNNTATAGDLILVTGELGGSLLGRHLTFEPRCRFAEHVARNYQVGAVTDISDSLTADLDLLLKLSDCGAILDLASVPVSVDAKTMHEQGSGLSPLEHALFDGEDFELILTVDPAVYDLMQDDPELDNRLFKIGVVTPIPGLHDSQGNVIQVKGYQHGNE